MEKGIGILKINLRKLKEEFGKAQLDALPESCNLSESLIAIRADYYLEMIQALEEAKKIIEFFNRFEIWDRFSGEASERFIYGESQNLNPSEEWLERFEE